MSVVTNRHRHGHARLTADDYAQALEAISEQLSQLNWVTSLIVCGSFVKGSLVPGWSDLDLVAIYDGPLTQERTGKMRIRLDRLSNPSLPIGIDYVTGSTLSTTRRIVGRPLAMTLELQEYAKTVIGTNPFAAIERLPEDRDRIGLESEMLVRSVANSWLRHSIAGFLSPSDRLFDGTKTLLRIAMFESSPLPKSGFTVADYCTAVRAITKHDGVVRAFTLAEEIRRDWPEIVEHPIQPDDPRFQVIEDALIYYCERWTPTW